MSFTPPKDGGTRPAATTTAASSPPRRMRISGSEKGRHRSAPARGRRKAYASRSRHIGYRVGQQARLWKAPVDWATISGMAVYSKAWGYAIHEAAHAVVAHLCGFHVQRVRIAPESARGACEIDRGFDPDDACFLVRQHAKETTAAELLPLLKRDLAGRLAGIAAEEIHGIQGTEEENRRDVECADKLARDILHATWLRSNPRPRFSERESIPAYQERMRDFLVNHILKPYAAVINAFAIELVSKNDLTGEQVSELFERESLPFGAVQDQALP